MNTIYKVIWNDALRLFQVVNEMTRSRKRACSVKSVHTETVGGRCPKEFSRHGHNRCGLNCSRQCVG